jgi:uncharacterized protein YegP (UPF0339 family)
MTLVERPVAERPYRAGEPLEKWDKAMIEYQYRESSDGQHYVVIRGANHEVIFTSELYKDKRDAKNAVQLIFDAGAHMMPCLTEQEKQDEGTTDGVRGSEEEPGSSGGEDVDGPV